MEPILSLCGGVFLGAFLYSFISSIYRTSKTPLKWEVVKWVPGRRRMVPYTVGVYRSRERAMKVASRRSKWGTFQHTVEELED